LVTSSNDADQHRREVSRLYEQLRRLEPEVQIAFALFELDGRSLGQVAELTGVSWAQAQGRLGRARAELEVAARRDEALARWLKEQDAGQR
jgi:DNA-directed RNA polymerase specialized sigma24 family protein